MVYNPKPNPAKGIAGDQSMTPENPSELSGNSRQLPQRNPLLLQPADPFWEYGPVSPWVSLSAFLWPWALPLISLYVVVILKEKLHFLQVADNFSVEIQQARRFEKNYFLYGTNLSEAANHVNTALTLLQTNVLQLKGVIGKPNYDILDEPHRDLSKTLGKPSNPG